MPSFEKLAQRVIQRLRREDAQGENVPAVPIAYVDQDNTERAARGDDDGLYTQAIGRASSTGTSDVQVAAGESQRLLVDLDGKLWVNASPAPGAIQMVEGDIAADAPDTAAALPVKIGGVAATPSTGLTAVSALGDRTNLATDTHGRALALVAGVIAVGEVADDTNAPPVSVGGTAAPTAGGFGAVQDLDRTVMATDVNGRQIVRAVGGVAHDDADLSTCPPVKIGARAASSIAGFGSDVAVGDVTDLAADRGGVQLVALGGGRQWAKSNTAALGTPVTSVQISANPAIIGRISITADEANAMYALVFDAASATGAPIDRFFIPASQTAVRDYTGEGGLACGTACFVQLTTDVGAITAPLTGAYIHAVYQAF